MKEYKTSNIEFEVLGKPCAKSRPRFRRMGNYVQTYSTEENINYENLIKVNVYKWWIYKDTTKNAN